MGSDPDELGVSTSLDRQRDLSSGRETAVGPRRLPGAQRRGADPPRVSRQRSVQSLDALVATDPSAGLGSADADDHRRSLSCCESRDLGAHDRLGCGQAHERSLVCRRYQGSPCLFLTLQNFSYILEDYKKRWKIEVLFQALKSRGFNLEATHLKDEERLKTLFSV